VRGAVLAACWQDEGLMCGCREGVVISEGGGVARGRELGERPPVAHGGGVVSAREVSSGRLYRPDDFPLCGHGPEAGHGVQGPRHLRPWQRGVRQCCAA
jgi:hypothetical protein